MRNSAIITLLIVLCALLNSATLIAPVLGQSEQEESAPLGAEDTGEQLTTKQSRVADRYDQLEMLAGRLAELSRATQPRRARLLRELVAKSRERDISGRFGTIVEALQVESLGKASAAQDELQSDLQTLLDLLLQEDRDKQIESERKRIRKYLAELKQLIQRQRGIKARTDGGDDAQPITDDQQRLSEATEKLEHEINANEIAPKQSAAENQPTAETESGEASPEDADAPESGTEESNAETDSNKNDASQSDSDEKSSDNKSSDPADADEKSQDGSPQSQDGQPSDQQPTDQQNSEGEPSQGGKPSDSRPSEGQPSQSQPSQGETDSSEQSEEPSEQSQSPAERAQQRLQRAQQRMQKALEELEKANRDNAVKRQEEALRELEQAKAELERILRQLREEERERMLVQLEARFRKMLDAQTIVYEQTKKLDSTRSSVPEHEVEIASGRLSRQEREIVREADRCLVLLREDGTTVAFPEAIEQARDDMQSVQNRLSEVKTAVITQGLEEDIITALEEALAALQQAIKKARAQQGQPQQQSSGSPEDQDLIDQLEELRMIRALQNRVNRRTQRYGEIIGDQITADPDLLEALDELALRQERIFQATRDLDTGRNK